MMRHSSYFSDDHETFRQSVRDFVEREITPHADAWEDERAIPRRIWERMGDEGLLGIMFPEELGGAGADVFYALAFLEEIPRSLMGGFVAAVSVQQFIATGAIALHGSDTLKRRYLEPSIRGRMIGSISISEPDIGSDVASLRTAAVRDGDQWVINGAKMWITNGVHGDFNVVACRTTPDGGPAGTSLIIVDRDTPGVTASPIRKIGWHSSDTAEIAFEDARVPAANLIGRENMGFYYIMETFAIERIVAAGSAVGACDVAIEKTLTYMREREAFGRPVAKFQALRHRMADLMTEVEAARQLVYHAAWLHQQGRPATRESAMAKLFATELNKRVADECLQFFGGYGYTDEYPISRFFRDARVSTIVAGTSEIMREIIAKIDIDEVRFPSLEEREPEAASSPAHAAGSEESVAPATTSAAEPTVRSIFESLPGRFRSERYPDWNATFHFTISGAEQETWTVRILDGACEVQPGHLDEADCTVSMKEGTYLGIESGETDPQMAVLMGKVKISHLASMMRFAKCFER